MAQAQAQQQIEKTDEMPLAVKTLRDDLNRMQDQFTYALPPHIPAARFMRVVMTAVQRSPKLLKCTRQSFFNACMSAASDGLLPDGREGAIVPYGDDGDGGSAKSENAQWLPMIGGIRKKVRNSGALVDWNVQVVQEGDVFDYQLGDSPYINHKPSPTGGRARPVLFAYSIATYPDGTKSREVMNIDQLRDIQRKSKAKKGPWSDPVFFPEMCRKTVAKLHAKQLPMSTDLDRLLSRDDALYDFTGASDRRAVPKVVPRPGSVAAALDTFGAAALPAPAQTAESNQGAQASATPATERESTPSADERSQQGDGAQSSGEPTQGTGKAVNPSPEPSTGSATVAPDDRIATAYRRGTESKAAGHARKAVPMEYRDPARQPEADAWQAGWDGRPEPTTGLI